MELCENINFRFEDTLVCDRTHNMRKAVKGTTHRSLTKQFGTY